MRKESKRIKSASGGDSTQSSAPFIAKPAEIDPILASLFASSSEPAKPRKERPISNGHIKRKSEVVAKDLSSEASEDEPAESGSEEGQESSEKSEIDETGDVSSAAEESVAIVEEVRPVRKRKRKHGGEDVEGEYMQRLAREEEREELKMRAERRDKRQKLLSVSDEAPDATEDGEEDSEAGGSGFQDEDADSDMDVLEIPEHESLSAPADSSEFERASRTVFLGNVSSQAISSKSAKKVLLSHLSSFLPSLPSHQPPHSVESFRFRSTAYSNKLPKKAAFAKKEIMDTTTKSTNAYVVYSTKIAAKEAARRLNGTVILDRHLRADEVAHPAKTDHRRCIFVGNLGFVDDESQIQAAGEQEGKRKQKKREPGDVEEGLWREFGKVGKVESVRVVRDPKTRVGKGFAYVQFVDENSVEAALLHNDKRFPPLLPRKIRVIRAKPVKRNATTKGQQAKPHGIYNPKISTREKSMQGRARKMLGRAGAAHIKHGRTGFTGNPDLKTPESFVFEGHRASRASGLSGLKLGGSGKKKGGKARNGRKKRADAWKASGGKKPSK